MAAGPLENVLQFVPVIDFLKIQRLDRRAGYDESIEFLLFDFVPRFVEGQQMFLSCIFSICGPTRAPASFPPAAALHQPDGQSAFLYELYWASG